MGTLPDDTRCAYCDAELAGYIPDGCVGPVGAACLDLYLSRGGWALAQVRLRRRAMIWRNVARGPGGWRAAQGPAHASAGFRTILDVEALAEHIARFCIHC